MNSHPPHTFRYRFALAVLMVLTGMSMSRAADKAPVSIQVILWFDTEDYLLPADDDATKRLCELLTERGIRATFKLVGEKARVLERRGRKDVITALRRHDIGYHTDFHSVHPTPTEYLADCGWLDGIAEFVRREGDGAADVRRILGVSALACYGQPGSSWAPQAIAALPQIGVSVQGVSCYVDDDSHIGMDGTPFWYAGALNVFRMRPNLARMELHDPADVGPARKRFSDIAERLRSEGGGLISMFYHPCEWVHREFWDGVNFARGANPPREQWRPPGQLPAAETDAAFKRFAEYIDYIRAIPGVRWITASDLPGLYPDLVRSEGASEADLDELARRIRDAGGTGLDYQRVGSRAYSVADQFELLTLALNELISGRPLKFPLIGNGLLGPDSPPPASSLRTLNGLAFRDALCDVCGYIRTEGRVPARVFVGAEAVPPADFLVALAAAWGLHGETGESPTNQDLELGQDTRVLPERYLAKETPHLFGDWIIHRESFRAPKLMELARLQTWTLKPAITKP